MAVSKPKGYLEIQWLYHHIIIIIVHIEMWAFGFFSGGYSPYLKQKRSWSWSNSIRTPPRDRAAPDKIVNVKGTRQHVLPHPGR